MISCACRAKESSHGFTRVELVVVLAVLALLAMVTRPVWGNDSQPKSLMCLDNLRRLSAAWLLYTDDSSGKFVGNYPAWSPSTPPARPWVTGVLDWYTTPDNTNTVYLTDPRYAGLALYLGGATSPYRCPADEYVSVFQAPSRLGRVRSYAMNCFVGEGNQTSFPLLDPAYVIYRRPVEFRRVSPRQVFVFFEEHLDSLSDGVFWAPNPLRGWVDYPGSLHNGAAWLSYADGHVELRRWVNERTIRPVVAAPGSRPDIQATPDDPDLVWVRDHASELK